MTGKEMIITNPEEAIQIVIINTRATDEQKKEYYEKVNKYDNGIVILEDKIIYKNQLLSQGIEYKYENIASVYDISEITKDDIIKTIEEINGLKIYISFFLVIIIYLFIIYLASAIVDIAMLGILGFIVSRIVGIKMKYSACFNMGVYALTLPTILNLIYILVNVFKTFEVKYFGWMYTTISYIYIIVAILIIKSDLINKQMELMKIIEEQEKVKKQIEEEQRNKEEEEKEKTKDENKKEPEEEKKNNKKKNGLDDTGLAPQE